MTLPSALAAIVRAFVATPADRDAFVLKNRDVLGSLDAANKRSIWALLQERSHG